MPTETLFADKKGMVYLNCHSCRNISVQPVDQFFNAPQPIRISCACGNTYEVQIEFRKSFRKKAVLEGFYARLVPPGNFEKITVTDISMGGCRFLACDGHHLKKGDLVKLIFNLDNADRTKITKDAMICSFDKWSLGCKFLATGSGLDSDIAFFIRST